MGDDPSGSSDKSLVLNAFALSNRDFYEVDDTVPLIVFVRGHKALLPAMRKGALTEIEAAVKRGRKHVIFDFSALKSLGSEWNWILVQLGRAVEALSKRVAVTNVTPALMAYLKSQGLDSVALTGPNIAAVCKQLGVGGYSDEKSTVKVEMINPFLASLVQVFEAQLRIKPVSGSVYVRKPEAGALGDYCGVIEVHSPNLRGLVVFSFPAETIGRFVEAVHGVAGIKSLDAIKDSIGEITNIAFTRGKNELNSRGYGIFGALPSTLQREELSKAFPGYNGPSITVPFESPIGPFFAEIRLAA